MRGFALLKGATFKWNDAPFRIERLQPNGDLLLERTDDGQLSLVPRDQLLAAYGLGEVSAASARPPSADAVQAYSRPVDELSIAVQKEMVRRRHYVKSLLQRGTVVFTPAFMQPIIAVLAAEIGDETPPSVSTLYRWCSRYRSDRDNRALVPRYDRRGPSGSRQNTQILQFASQAIEEAFKFSPKATVSSVYARLVAKIDAENLDRPVAEQLKRPNVRTLYRMMAAIESFDQVTLREGKSEANRRFHLSKKGVQTENILERAEIDHTPLDLFLIDERTWLPLGRPTLTVIIDHFSRMLLGYYLRFDSPSAAAVIGALRHAILPKTPSIEAIPGLKIEHAWPCYGRPDLLVVDNGLEFHGKDLESVSFDLDMRIQYCPKHQPRFKGVVERYLKTINYFFAHQLPGTSFARLHQRGDYDPAEHAVLTLAEFKHLFDKWVADVYAQTLHRGIGTTPWARWHEGLNRRQPELAADLRQLQQRIGLVSERALRHDGLWLLGIRYTGDALQPIFRAFGEGVRVRVVYDPEDLGAIQVWGPNDETPATISAADPSYASGLTARQNEMIRSYLREQGASTEDRAELDRAKNQLAVSVEELMASRKQRHRRRAASLQGPNSGKPAAKPVDNRIVASTPIATEKISSGHAIDAPPVPAYATFQLSRQDAK